MKKFLVLGSLAAVLLVTGCSQKSGVDSNTDATQGKGYASGQDFKVYFLILISLLCAMICRV